MQTCRKLSLSSESALKKSFYSWDNALFVLLPLLPVLYRTQILEPLTNQKISCSLLNLLALSLTQRACSEWTSVSVTGDTCHHPFIGMWGKQSSIQTSQTQWGIGFISAFCLDQSLKWTFLEIIKIYSKRVQEMLILASPGPYSS